MMKARPAQRTRKTQPSVADLEVRAAEVASLLGALANPRRLIILCRLSMAGECGVGALAEAVGISQSALSQHLAVLRTQGIVATRRDGLNIFYSISDPQTRDLMRALEKIFCHPEEDR